MSLQFTHVKQDDGSAVISVFVPGEPAYVAVSDHPNFDLILDAAIEGDLDIGELFDVSRTVAKRFEPLSTRVSVANGVVYFDGDPVDNSLTKHIVRTLDENGDFTPLVRFYENVQQNPDAHSRENLYRWLDAADFTIDAYGDIVGYKGIALNSSGIPVSIHSGRAIVDGEVQTGRIPNQNGSIIEMPRSEVNHDPATGCSTGLHVGTWDYAKAFGNGGTLEVRVNPRDVVSVPTDSSDQKLRTCRYEVIKLISEPYTSAILDDVEDGYDGWGELDEDDE